MQKIFSLYVNIIDTICIKVGRFVMYGVFFMMFLLILSFVTRNIINYPLMWIIVGILLVISLMIFFIFGQKIRNYFTIRRLKKEYGLFSNFISQSINVLKESVDRERAAQSLTQWKNYLERIELQPFSKLTTKEILALEFTSELKEALRNIDKNVYGNHRDPELYKSFQDIEDFTQHRFHMKIADIKNGK